jgi:hypothetical protein
VGWTRWFAASAATVGLLLGSSRLYAQANYQTQPLGGISALMGGTGIALGRDSAAPLLNPAGIARINASSLALASQLVQVSRRNISGAIQPGPGPSGEVSDVVFADSDITDFGFRVLPSTACYFQNIGTSSVTRAGNHAISFCIATTEDRGLSSYGVGRTGASEVGTFSYGGSFETQWSRRDFAFSWGTYLREWLSIGASAIMGQSSLRLLTASTGMAEDAQTGIGRRNDFQSGKSGNTIDLRAEFGVLVHFDDHWSLGASARTPSVSIINGYDASSSVGSLDGSSQAQVDSGSLNAPTALRFGVGLGYDSGDFSFEFDVFMYPGDSKFISVEADRVAKTIAADGTVTTENSQIDLRSPSKFVANFGAGVRYRLDDHLSLLGGLHTDFGALADFASTVEQRNGVVLNSRDAYHAAAGIGYEGGFGEIISGLRGSYSTGDAVTVNHLVNTPVPAVVQDREFAILLIVYGVIDFGAIGKAIYD